MKIIVTTDSGEKMGEIQAKLSENDLMTGMFNKHPRYINQDWFLGFEGLVESAMYAEMFQNEKRE